MQARPSMVISPFASLTAKEARTTSAPMLGEACVLTDQEIEVRAARLCQYTALYAHQHTVNRVAITTL